jgi:hypothetical protein
VHLSSTRSARAVLLAFALPCASLPCLLGCGGGANRDGEDPKDTSIGTSDGAPIDADPGSDAGFDIGDKAVTSLEIDPATSSLVVSDLAAPPSVTLRAIAVYADGTKAPTTAASWTLDRFDVASVGAGTGVVKATGKLGGNVIVNATLGTLTATAKVTVSLKLAIDPGGAVPPADRATLTAATDADPTVTKILYPYDKTVFPKGLLGPEVMWNGGASSDTYQLHLTGPFTDISIYGSAAPPSAMKIDPAVWDALTTSVTSGGVESDVAVELRRLKSGGKAYVSAKSTWHVADANLRGTIYYWAVNRGELVKIKPGAAAPVAAFDAGDASSLGTPAPLNSAGAPTPAWQDNGSGKKCVACHAVSKDGSRLSSIFSTPRGSQGPNGFVDLKTAKVNAVSDYTQNLTFTSISPDGRKAVANTSDMKLRLLDALTGAPIGSALDAATPAYGKAADPVFSNAGKMLAFAGNAVGGYPVEYSSSDLMLFDFADATNAFSGLRTIVKGTGSSDAFAFPSFSPDDKFVFYQRGNYSRAKYGTNQHGVDDIYAVAATGGTPIALDALNGKGIVTGDNIHLNYQPTVNPIAEGGYFWVVFVSPRDYGNKMVSPQAAAPSDCTYANRKQLWVAAVDASMKLPDPSHPAFWLPGQALDTINMAGYWTLEPCKPTPKDGSVASCTAGFECCSGFCRDGADGKPTCVDPPTGCHKLSETCTTDADCCDGASCIGGICTKKRPS